MDNYYKVINGIYNIGNSKTRNGLDCNPYLLVDGDEAILFDPGSKNDFKFVFESIKSLIDINMIKYVVLHHQDADMCASVPLFEDAGLEFMIVTSWRAMTLIEYYGVKSKYYLLEENEHRLELSSGRTFDFIRTPYLHFPGAFVTYDKETKSLFSSDIFGAFTFNRTLIADDNYMGKMLTFHENYMPSNSILRPVMDTLLKYDIDRILPQHGSMILDEPQKYIEALRELECGVLLSPIKKDLMESGGYKRVFSDIYKRLKSLYVEDEVDELFKSMSYLIFDEKMELQDYIGNPLDVWNMIFDDIGSKKSMIWIAVIEPFVRTLCSSYDIKLPYTIDKIIVKAEEENNRLKEINNSLEKSIRSVNERLTKCSITGLYNEVFFRSFLADELEQEDWRDIGALAVIDIDDLSKFLVRYGEEEEKNLLNSIAYTIKGFVGENSVFRMDISDFAVYFKGISDDDVRLKVEQIRMDIEKSDLFLDDITISAGIVYPGELELDKPSYEMTVNSYMFLAANRLRKSISLGRNSICSEGYGFDEEAGGKILVVDNDEINLEVIKSFLSDLGLDVYTASDGVEGLEIAERVIPSMIITEVNLPKKDGFNLREELLADSSTKSIEVIYLSYQKDEDSVIRASDLGVSHYIKKPYLISELVSIVKRNFKNI